MSIVDRYITDAVYPAWRSLTDNGFDVPPHAAGHAIRAALPGILAQHRADVLRDTANDIEQWLGEHGLRHQRGWVIAAQLRRWADEQVPE